LEPTPERYTKIKRRPKTDKKVAIGFHVPAVRRRDLFYAKLEDQRAASMGQV
jgi:hypothetical protein